MNKQDEVDHEESTANVKFLFIDCGPLKQALSSHCDLWQTKLSGLLARQAGAELRALHETFRAGLEALAEPPEDLAALAEAVGLHARLSEDRGRLAARFEPLRCARGRRGSCGCGAGETMPVAVRDVGNPKYANSNLSTTNPLNMKGQVPRAGEV
jgi:hypothetical protein